ncbi:hypothetical protein [Phenylobacterium sp.]|uniref:hypothetical protein n=1 Tax=Phenylobacterium sp. TaxID=1871053 RepID=UPI00260CE372|nr:hypothetical protein [Phenylobacterium sp.]
MRTNADGFMTPDLREKIPGEEKVRLSNPLSPERRHRQGAAAGGPGQEERQWPMETPRRTP